MNKTLNDIKDGNKNKYICNNEYFTYSKFSHRISDIFSYINTKVSWDNNAKLINNAK